MTNHSCEWQLQEAKNKLSQVINQAINLEPQVITLRGKEVVVVLSVDEYRRLIQPKKDLVAFLADSPLRGVELDLDRDKSLSRDIDL